MVIASATPASAHALDGAGPTNFRTRIKTLEPPTPGIEVNAVEAGSRIELKNVSDTEVVVIGYAKEPYLRVGPDGVFENTRSPATYLNSSRIPTGELPPQADSTGKAAPEWRKVSSASSFRWHDHRTHWMGNNDPPAVRRAPDKTHVIFPSFSVPLRVGGVDGSEVLVKGDLTWVPGPSSVPWLALAAVAGVALAVLAGPRGGQASSAVIIAVLVALVALDAVRLAGLAAESDKSIVSALSANLLAIGSWLAAGLAVWRLLVEDTRTALPLAALAGLFFAFGGALDLSILSRSQLPTVSPAWFARLAVSAVLGLGLGLAGAAATRLTTAPSTPIA